MCFHSGPVGGSRNPHLTGQVAGSELVSPGDAGGPLRQKHLWSGLVVWASVALAVTGQTQQSLSRKGKQQVQSF